MAAQNESFQKMLRDCSKIHDDFAPHYDPRFDERNSPYFKEFDVDERFDILVKKSIYKKEEISQKRDDCSNCWLLTRNCICNDLQLCPNANWFPHRILLLMHYREYKRTSNTGKAIVASLPSAVTLYLYGLESSMETLLAAIDEDPYRTCVLFPGKQASTVMNFIAELDKPETYAPINIPAEETEDITNFDLGAVFDEENPVNHDDAEKEQKEKVKQEDETVDQIKSCYHGRPINIILLDGTWTQAKHMFKELTTQYLERTRFTRRIKAVALQPDTLSRFRARQQPTPDRVSTLEAFALFCRQLPLEIGRLPKVDEDVMNTNMDLTVDKMLIQSGVPDKTNQKRWHQH